MKLNKKTILFFSILLFCGMLLYPAKEVLAATTTVNVNPGSPTFNVPAGFTSVKITAGWVDDRGPLSINGTAVVFRCSNGAPGCPEANNFWVGPGTACIAANVIGPPVDITSLVNIGNNTMSAVVDNCGGGPSGWAASIEIATPDACANLSCEAANAILPCDCGTATADAANPWCCAGNNAVYNTVDLCKVGACAVIPPPPFCVTGPTGGLVPCGRMIDNLDTAWNETEPCKLCHFIILAKNIIDLLIKLAGIIALLAIVVGGFIYMVSAGNTSLISNAKNDITKALWGFVIIFVAWVVINVIMVFFGFIDPLGDGSWAKFNCNLNTVPSFCGDGIVSGTEVCDSSSKNCTTNTPIAGLPAYCSGDVEVPGTQNCNSCCSGWDDCIAGPPPPPTLVSDNYGECDDADIFFTDYPCCELIDCHNDGCCGGANSCDASLPGGYTLRSTLINTDVNQGNCKLGQSGNNWVVSVCHTTAGYQCWSY